MHPGRVKGLFVTHLHGDHCFGIPGLLRSVSDSRAGTPLEGETFRIFGPPGLHGLITAAFSFDTTPPCMPLVSCPLLTALPRPGLLQAFLPLRGSLCKQWWAAGAENSKVSHCYIGCYA